MLMHKLMAYLAETELPSRYIDSTYTVCGVVNENKADRDSRFFEASPRDFVLVGIIDTEPDSVSYTSYTIFTHNDVVSLTINEQSAGNGFAIGSALSAQYRLVLEKNVVSELTSEAINNAWIAIMIGIKEALNGSDHYYFEPFGVWHVDKSTTSEQDPTIQLEGFDAMGGYYSYQSVREMWWLSGAYELVFIEDEDDLTWSLAYDPLRTIRDQLNRFTNRQYSNYYGKDVTYDGVNGYISTDANIYFFDNYGPNASILNYNIVENEKLYMDIYDNNYSWRDLIALVAGAVGGFAFINRCGALEFKHYNRYFASEYAAFISPENYYSYASNSTKSFDLEYAYITYITDQTGEKYKVLHRPFDYVLSGGGAVIKPYSSYDTVFIGENPLITESIATSLANMFLSNYQRFNSEVAEVSFPGAPAIEVGDLVSIADTLSVQHDFIINSMTTTFDGGLQQTIACTLPSESEATGTDTPSTTSTTSTGTGSGTAVNYYTAGEAYTGMRWIDGKPIYRFVTTFSTTSTSTSTLYFDDNAIPSDWDIIINIYGMVINPNGNTTSINAAIYNGASQAVYVIRSNAASHANALAVRFNNNVASGTKTFYVIVEYTRQDDTGQSDGDEIILVE